MSPLLLLIALAAPGQTPADPLAAEIERLSSFLKGNPSTDELWMDVKKSSEPALARAQAALGEKRRLLALQRLAPAHVNLAASAYAQERPPELRKEGPAFEAEWTRMGDVLKADLGALSPGALEGVHPAAVRALGEASLPQVRAFYEASLDYGRNTMPEYGIFYLGAARAARDFTGLCRRLSVASDRPVPTLRALVGELDALETELLAAYRPPASIDKHREFIAASSTLNEARTLDAAGLRYGALLRYLQAALRAAALSAPAASAEVAKRGERLREMETRVSASALDPSLARIFLESAAEDLAAAQRGPTPGEGAPAGPVTAAAILEDVLPRYFAALEPPRPASARAPAEVTVTLVRWPFT